MVREWAVDPEEFDGKSNDYELADQRLVAVVDAVEALPKRLRDVINAVYWEGLSHPEAIKSLRLAPSTYFARLKRAQAKVHAALQGQDSVGAVPAAGPEAVPVPQEAA